MVEYKTIGISVLMSMIAFGAIVITPDFFDTPKYACESEGTVKECPGGISGGLGTRCYDDKEHTGWDYCKTGWILVTDDTPTHEDPTVEPSTTSGASKCYPADKRGGTPPPCVPVEV